MKELRELQKQEVPELSELVQMMLGEATPKLRNEPTEEATMIKTVQKKS